MVNRLSTSAFIAIALIVMGTALLPIVRFVAGVDSELGIQFLTFIYLLIAGLMCGLVGMLLILKRQPIAELAGQKIIHDSRVVWLHASGLLLYSGIPLANFLAGYYLWNKYRRTSSSMDIHGREVLCFQVTIYLYLLLALFMVIALFGLFALPLILLFHLITTLTAIAVSAKGKIFRYPANISIIDRALN